MSDSDKPRSAQDHAKDIVERCDPDQEGGDG